MEQTTSSRQPASSSSKHASSKQQQPASRQTRASSSTKHASSKQQQPASSQEPGADEMPAAATKQQQQQQVPRRRRVELNHARGGCIVLIYQVTALRSAKARQTPASYSQVSTLIYEQKMFKHILGYLLAISISCPRAAVMASTTRISSLISAWLTCIREHRCLSSRGGKEYSFD